MISAVEIYTFFLKFFRPFNNNSQHLGSFYCDSKFLNILPLKFRRVLFKLGSNLIVYFFSINCKKILHHRTPLWSIFIGKL
jgi:hypothetical protein